MASKKSGKAKKAQSTPPAQRFDPLSVLKVLDDAASSAPLTRQGHVNVQQAVKILTAILAAPEPSTKKEGEEDDRS